MRGTQRTARTCDPQRNDELDQVAGRRGLTAEAQRQRHLLAVFVQANVCGVVHQTLVAHQALDFVAHRAALAHDVVDDIKRLLNHQLCGL